MQVYDNADLHGAQRLSEVKYAKLCAIITKLGQKNPWCMFMMIMTFLEVKGLQRSNTVIYATKLSYLVKRIAVTSLKYFHVDQRSNGINYNKLCSMATNLVKDHL